MSKPLAFNAFVMNTGSHIQHGQWRHPEAQQAEFNDVNMWINLAKTLEEGLFDAMFFADVSGLYGPADGQYVDNVHEGLQIPSNDPTVLLGALAVVTKHIGLATTSNMMQNHPFNFARQLSTLDHISTGRVAWNIVTSTQENAARNFGYPALTEHDARYDWADEYLEVLYKLWEGSWDEGALLKDKEGGRFSDPSKIHKIYHEGPRYKVEGPHLPSPSPQRTPLLFQAGGSERGIQFAAQHAECQFIVTPNPDVAREHIARTREVIVKAGRQPEDVKFFQGLSLVIGRDEKEVREREEDYIKYSSVTGFLTHSSLGILPDGTRLPDDTRLIDIPNNGGQAHVEWLRRATPDREPTLADLANGRIRRGYVAGTPDQIADKLVEWQAAGVDGINLINWRLPGSYEEFNELLLPTLQHRGLAKKEYAEGTLRQKLFGHDHLNERHPGSTYRGAFTPVAAGQH